ncbi:hypothetical protein BD324DRAFT_606986 [Kockovaella imperatae]|uniref:Inositol polyphosphate-related phosphatase domain-containing protein n=1 Tax=Kockovaella imperatae TaxID=4999 RepID=A0A1Y1UP11_9TREE|nr:hypothetical protein BD324DRAFT_606986 [Kockovaella imperatae]ORX39732.1 hypothetical protein BD324DRAFT_606986 [Kockovaella imperatae]
MPSLRVFHRALPLNDQRHPPASRPAQSRDSLTVPVASPGLSAVSSNPSSSSSLTPTAEHPPGGSAFRAAQPGEASRTQASSTDGHRVLSRLHALFNTPANIYAPGSRPNGGTAEISRVKTEPSGIGLRDSEIFGVTNQGSQVPAVKDRDAIKVLIVTWNMGETLPKGDLSVLLGDVPTYDGSHPSGPLPMFPTEHGHPYHIVVVAGQECPTHSGVPRGWGGGLMKGVRGAHKKHKDERQKEGDKAVIGEEDEEMDEDEGSEAALHVNEVQRLKVEERATAQSNKCSPLPSPRRPQSPAGNKSDDASSADGHCKSPRVPIDDDEGRSQRLSHSSSMERGHGSLLHRHNHGGGSKGWSTMLDDWFCGPSASRRANHSSQDSHPAQTPNHTSLSPPRATPHLIRSFSAPESPTSASLVQPPSPSDRLAIPVTSRSPLSRSISTTGSIASSDSSSASTPSADIPVEILSASPPALALPKPLVPPIDIPKGGLTVPHPVHVGSIDERLMVKPELVVPLEEGRTVGGEKCYLHLIKERLMGMYLSVYVYKGCEHLIQGVDKDFVTAGLAGGRVGNKGGIGISLKLADHRFLFVNSHLAAHTARVNARLSNIAKIKSELRLDTFLAKDDQLNELEDLTDRFDTVFWCGDLNFRLDLSRLHAEWLVEKKKYSEALMWDQLKNAMKDEAKNPFPGFQEHTIDFPPTFKYDVWRSLKATNRELRRNLRRRGTMDNRQAKQITNGPETPVTPIQDKLPHVLESHAEHAGELADNRSFLSQRESDEDARTIHSRRSIDSSVYQSGVPSTAGTDVSDAESMFRQPIDSSAYGSKHKALEVAIKSKTKKFLGLVKMDGVFRSVSSSSRRASDRRPQLGRSYEEDSPRPSGDFDAESRRTSISSMGTMLTQDNEFATSLGDGNKVNGLLVPGVLPNPQTPELAPASSPMSPPRRGIRRLSMVRRMPSTRSTKDRQSHEDHSREGELDELDTTDRREGVYDTSKKQRVPSWCDRVLWKTRVVPDAPESPPDSPWSSQMMDSSHSHRPLNRLSQAFVNFGGHLRLPVSRSNTIEPAASDRHLGTRILGSMARRGSIETRSESPHPVDTSGGPALLVNSPENSPRDLVTDQISPHNTKITIPSPRRPTLIIPDTDMKRQRSAGVSPHPLLDNLGSKISPPADPKVTFDPALAADRDRGMATAVGSMYRRRANSDSVPVGMTSPLSLEPDKEASSPSLRFDTSAAQPIRRLSLPRHTSRHNSYDQAKGVPKAPTETTRRTSGGSLRMRSRTRTLDSVTSTSTAISSRITPHNLFRGSTSGANDRGDDAQDDSNAFVKFLRDIQSLPNWLHRGSVVTPVSPVVAPVVEDVKPARHQHGEVVCMHYGTIDDAGMRQLEGRSDHRPAIFSAAVYVG